MSRIYQGGQSERRYQSRVRQQAYQPTQVASNVKKLQQQGQQILDDLKTKERERVRGDRLDNLERDTSFKADQLNLQVIQKAEAGRFKFQQDVEKLALRNAQGQEQRALRQISTDAKNKFENTQLELKNSFTETQQASKFAQDRAFSQQQNSLKSSQLASEQALKSQQMNENFIIGANLRGLQAQNQVDRSQLQAEQTAASAQTKLTQIAVEGLLKFAGVGLEVAELISDQRIAQEKKDAELDAAFGWLRTGGATTGDSVEGVIADQRDLNTLEVAEEEAFGKVSGGNPIIAEQLRQPEADASMDRNLRQASVGEAAIRFQADYDALISDPNFRAIMPDGQSKSLGELRNTSELADFLTAAARQLTSEYGISGKDKHSMLVNYGQKARAAYSAAYQRLGSEVIKGANNDRYDAALANAATYGNNKNFQLAWETARTGAKSSGLFFGDSNRDINDRVLKDLMSRLPDDSLKELKNVLKNPGQKGTEFGKDRYYSDMIDDEIDSRNGEIITRDRNQSSLNQIKVDAISNATNKALLEAPDADSAKAIRVDAINQLTELGTPEADDLISKLRLKGSTNVNVLLDLQEGFDSGIPPTSEQISDAYASGAITHAQKEALLKRGQLGDEVDARFKETGLPDIDKLVETTVVEALAGFNVDPEERRARVAGIVADLTPEFEAKVRQYLVNNPQDSPGKIRQEIDNMQDDLFKRLDPKTDSGLLQKGEDGRLEFDYTTTRSGYVPTRINQVTGQVSRVFTNVDVRQIPKSASVNDVFITKDEFLGGVEVWQAGGQNYSLRIKALAAHLDISPEWLIKSQAKALGYESIGAMAPELPSSGSFYTDPVVKPALNVIGSYESDNVGGYNAVNQGGTDEGNTPLGYSGDIRKSKLWGGAALTDMSIAEIMEYQVDMGQGQAAFEARGGLHAVGRYQFIGDTLKWVVAETGISPSQKFTPEVQDYLGSWLLAKSHNGIGQWVGPNKYASAAERDVVRSARIKLQGAYRILNNPSAGKIQKDRARRIVGNPFI